MDKEFKKDKPFVQSEPIIVNTEGKKMESANEPIAAGRKQCLLSKCRGFCQKMSVKTAVIAAIVLILLALGFYFKSAFVAATVNGSPVSRFAVIQKLEQVSGKQALDALITEKLVRAEAKKKKITVTPDEVKAEIAKIQENVKQGGGTLEEALKEQRMTMKDLEEQITLQKTVEKLISDKAVVTDDDVTKYISDYKVTLPKGQETAMKDRIKEQLKQQKLSEGGSALIDSLRSSSKIQYYAYQ